MKLVVVESPAKSKTISKYLGKDYVVKASVGHVRDLPKSNKNAVDIEGGFVPHYETVPAKQKVIDEITELAKKADEVILATDPDREGEAIAHHVAEAANIKKPKRVVFHEITKDAVGQAMRHPRAIDRNLLKAQEARRVLDRLVGYDLSGLIWKKVRYGLSAGRVQSPALRILVERERQIKAFEPEDFWILTADVETKNKEGFTLVCTEEPREEKEAKRIHEAAENGAWGVAEVSESQAKRSPRAPFTTSTLQQAASSRLGFSPANTMRLAQRLYEAGLITYMRTDSTTLARVAVSQISGIIKKKYGDELVGTRVYKTRSKAAQEAHEAIRPTDVSKENAGINEDQRKLYRLIWSRAVASQMKAARVMRTKITANIEGGGIPDFAANGSRTVFDGWLAADPAAKREDVELPKVSTGDPLDLCATTIEAKQTQPPSRYSEAGLVKELEKRGIGRPSTYASIIKTIQDRGYVVKEGKALHPTVTGEVVSSFLEENFMEYIDDDFTAKMEDELDEIAEGKREYEKTLREFYTPFHKDVESKKDIEKLTNLGSAPKEFPCPKCGAPMVMKLSKNGVFMSCSRFPECDGARTEVGEELEGPKDTGRVCPECGKANLVERDGKYGRFIACANYPKCKHVEEDPEEVEKRKTGVKCNVCNEGEMVERNGRFGVFYSCSRYPECKHAIKARPTGRICEYKKEDGSVCGALMMEGTKTIPERCSRKECPNHQPDKK